MQVSYLSHCSSLNSPSNLIGMLDAAVKNSQHEQLEVLLRQPRESFYEKFDRFGPGQTLLDALELGNDKVLKVLFEAGFDFNLKAPPHNWTVFIHLGIKGTVAQVKKAIEFGLKLTPSEFGLIDPMVVNKQIEQLLLLLRTMEEPSCVDAYGNNALLFAAHSAEAVQMLIYAGCNPNIKCASNQTPLRRACDKINNVAGVRCLLEAGAHIGVLYRSQTCLEVAIDSEDLEVVGLLAEFGGDVNANNSLGLTPLMQISLREENEKTIAIAKVLLQFGADRTLVSREGMTAMDYAENLGKEELLKLLKSRFTVKLL